MLPQINYNSKCNIKVSPSGITGNEGSVQKKREKKMHICTKASKLSSMEYSFSFFFLILTKAVIFCLERGEETSIVSRTTIYPR